MEELKLSLELPTDVNTLFHAWLDGKEHAAFTGAAAECDARTGGAFSAWDSYITGKTLEIDPGRRILQAWRTTEFPTDAPDSRLELTFEALAEGSRLTLVHTQIPDGQGEMYREGWEEYYFAPMREYFQGEK
jgi:activator of HSP90 ATPase